VFQSLTTNAKSVAGVTGFVGLDRGIQSYQIGSPRQVFDDLYYFADFLRKFVHSLEAARCIVDLARMRSTETRFAWTIFTLLAVCSRDFEIIMVSVARSLRQRV